VAHRDAVERASGLGPGERLLAAGRVARRGTSVIVGIAAGLGGAVGYVVATAEASTILRAAIGGGVGGGAGAAVGWLIATSVLRGGGGPGPLLSIGITTERFLALRRSALTNTPVEVVTAVPVDGVVGIELGPARLVFARTLTVVFDNGVEWDLETTRAERPETWTAALDEARRG
jgi:hypothetical protein